MRKLSQDMIKNNCSNNNIMYKIQIARNSLTLIGGQITVQISGIILGTLFARSLGESGYGQYSISLAFGIFSILFSMGVDSLVVRDLAQDNNKFINNLQKYLLCVL